jgi:hypothetical protein
MDPEIKKIAILVDGDFKGLNFKILLHFNSALSILILIFKGHVGF